MSSDDRFEKNLTRQNAPTLPTAGDVANRRQVIPTRKQADRNQFGAFTVTAKGLQVKGDARLEDWQEVGEYLFAFEGAVQWLIGDWLAFGEDVKWGDIPTIAEHLGRKPASLNQYAYVSRKVQISTRVEKLSWHHHLMVAKLPKERQQEALKHALDNGLNREDFATWLKGSPPPLLTSGGFISDKDVRSSITNMSKLRRKPRELWTKKERRDYFGGMEMVKRFLADNEEWIKEGGAGEGTGA